MVLHVLKYSLATRTVWNIIDDKDSNFVLHMEYLSSIVFHTVLLTNTIDARYPSIALLSNIATCVCFVCFDIFACHYRSTTTSK